MKVAFVLITHQPDDDRVWFQEAKSLMEAGCEIFIVKDATPSKKEQIKKLASALLNIHPNVIICDNPIAIFAAQRYKRQSKKKQTPIIYDITEWYPSKKNLRGLSPLRKIIKFIVLFFLSYFAAWFLDGFIFGERYKAKPFRFFFPWKRFIYLSYYADPKQVKIYPFRDISKECILFYAGNLTKEKGFYNVWKVAEACAAHFPDTQFVLKIISKDTHPEGAKNFLSGRSPYGNLKIQQLPLLPFLTFCEEVGKADIFFDLRDADLENTHCLPIKLFYYMASGRPVIYSNLKAIAKEVSEIDEVGRLVNPTDTHTILSYISRYINDKEAYQRQGLLARKLTEEKYNWASIEPVFVNFIREYGNV